RRLCTFSGVESVTLDFGISRRDVAVQCSQLPSELVRLAGSLGLNIELSLYPAIETGAPTTGTDGHEGLRNAAEGCRGWAPAQYGYRSCSGTACTGAGFCVSIPIRVRTT